MRNIGVATSTNCQSWTPNPSNPVVTTTEGGYGSGSNACVIMPSVAKYNLNGQTLYLMMIGASTYATSIPMLHLDYLFCANPNFSTTQYWNPNLGGNVLQPSGGVDCQILTTTSDGVGDTVALSNSLNLFFTVASYQVLHVLYQSGGNLLELTLGSTEIILQEQAVQQAQAGKFPAT